MTAPVNVVQVVRCPVVSAFFHARLPAPQRVSFPVAMYRGQTQQALLLVYGQTQMYLNG